MRHRTALVEIIIELDKKPKTLLLFTDGGADHRNTLESEMCSNMHF